MARQSIHVRCLTGTAMVALLTSLAGQAAAAQAQDTTSAGAAQTSQTDEKDIVVTGSRIVRNGYSAPTPLTVISTESLQAQKSSNNVIDVLVTNPAFQATSTSAGNSTLNNATGASAVNLRAGGAGRTLVLLDGQRPGSNDITTLPQQLISRIDVVTGGASAVYGSDAVVGVVNFILDRKFTGFKGELSGGTTNYGDAKNWSVSASWGAPILGGRGHILLSGEYADNNGIINDPGDRKWTTDTSGIMNNPAYTATNGQPQFIKASNMAYTHGTGGGLIFSGPLRGTAFGPGGVPYPYSYGTITSDPWTAGPGAQPELYRYRNGPSLDPSLERATVFGRLSYDLSDRLTIYGQASYNWYHGFDQQFQAYFTSTSGPVIKAENPFIPASVKQQMATAGVSTIQVATINNDMGVVLATGTRRVTRLVGGVDGSFDAFGSEWKWSGYGLYARDYNETVGYNNFLRSRYALATDAVNNPVTGAIVCRSTLTNPANGCVPWNPMGIGVNSNAARAYLSGGGSPGRWNGSYFNVTNTTSVQQLTLSGEPFSLPAGPVSLALAFEHRSESQKGFTDASSVAGDWFFQGTRTVPGSNNVTEGNVELVVPILKDSAIGKRLDLQGAFRGTNYKYSGYVSTWKIGGTYEPVDDITIRASYSRDIRAPGLTSILVPDPLPAAAQFSVIDPQLNNQSYATFVRSLPNPNLRPEIGYNTDIGVVLRPHFIPGLQMSVDYWRIKISGGIGSINANQALVLCQQGNQDACSTIVRDPVTRQATLITTTALNLAKELYRGIDFAASYRVPLFGGTLDAEVNATRYLDAYINQGVPGLLPVQLLGALGGNVPSGAANQGPPKWQAIGHLTYSQGPFSARATGRYRSAGTIDNNWIGCASGCPTATASRPTINDNTTKGYAYLDLAFSYRFKTAGGNWQAFLNVRNALNADPATVWIGPSGPQFFKPGTYTNVFDYLGRVYRLGVRVNF